MTWTGDERAALPSSGSGAGPSSVTRAWAEDGDGDHPQCGEILELGAEPTRYEIVRSLGTGGMAEVFLARRLGPAGFSRPVALKRLLAGLDKDGKTRRGFVYEAQLAARLRHPGIAEAYELALVGDRHYLVLEYVDGVTVRAVVRAARASGRRLDEGFCCHVAASVAEALHHAHALAGDDGRPLGIVHRDVTAANVMIGRSGAVKLLDFGVALARLPGRDRTRTGEFRGTFVYASPEQALGEPLDGRSDLFSLGVLLVEMLTGIRVFEAETDAGTMRRITECRAEDVAAATATLRPELAAICAKALARSAADRYEDGEAFSRALRRYLAVAGISYYSPGDCAAELRALGLVEEGRGPDVASAGSASASVSASASAPTASDVGAGALGDPDGSAPKRTRWRSWSPRALAAVLLVAASDLKGAPVPLPVAEAPTEAPTETTTSAAPQGELLEPIVRPRGSTNGARGANAPRAKQARAADREGHVAARRTSAAFADRATVESPRATLPRGTLVAVKLARPLVVGASPARAEAVVTEEVAAQGAVVVSRGSTVTCTARAPAGGRVPLSCDTIRTAGEVLTFSGVAVGDGERVGLRLMDDGIAVGTPFVVYVTAPAALR